MDNIIKECMTYLATLVSYLCASTKGGSQRKFIDRTKSIGGGIGWYTINKKTTELCDSWSFISKRVTTSNRKMSSLVKSVSTLNGSCTYSASFIYENDMDILNKMSGHLIATLQLMKLSNINVDSLVSFDSLSWKTPLGQYAANALTLFRDQKIGLLSQSVQRINRYRSRNLKAMNSFLVLIGQVEMQNYVDYCYYNSLSNEKQIGIFEKFDRVLKSEKSYSISSRSNSYVSHKSTSIKSRSNSYQSQGGRYYSTSFETHT